MRDARWWQFGLLGGAVLSLATLAKVIRALVRGAAEGVSWTELVSFAALIFGMGFVCGLVGWGGRGLSRRLGLLGDSLVGMAVMLVFVTACMLALDPESLGPKFLYGGLPMLGLGAIAGLVGGAWVGHDVRKEWAEQERKQRRDGDDDGFRLPEPESPSAPWDDLLK